MNIILIVVIVVTIFVIWALFAILKKLIKWAIILGLIALVLSFLTNGAIGQDLERFKSSLSEDRQLVRLVGSDKAFFTNPIEYAGKTIVVSQDIKTFTINPEVFDFDVVINNKKVTAKEIQNSLLLDQEIPEITYADLTLKVELPKKGEVANGLFPYLFEEELNPSSSPLRFVKAYKKGLIIIEPETLFFKAAKVLPAAWMEQKLNKAKEAVQSAVGNFIKEAK